MISALILAFTSLCAMGIITIYVIIVGIFFLDTFQYKLDEWLRDADPPFKGLQFNIIPIYIGLLIITIIYTGSVVCSQVYWTHVLLSFIEYFDPNFCSFQCFNGISHRSCVRYSKRLRKIKKNSNQETLQFH